VEGTAHCRARKARRRATLGALRPQGKREEALFDLRHTSAIGENRLRFNATDGKKTRKRTCERENHCSEAKLVEVKREGRTATGIKGGKIQL